MRPVYTCSSDEAVRARSSCCCTVTRGPPRPGTVWRLSWWGGHTVVCIDLPGYGRAGKPTPTADHRPHSKKVAAR